MVTPPVTLAHQATAGVTVRGEVGGGECRGAQEGRPESPPIYRKSVTFLCCTGPQRPLALLFASLTL